jgi:hypothetical protein
MAGRRQLARGAFSRITSAASQAPSAQAAVNTPNEMFNMRSKRPAAPRHQNAHQTDNGHPRPAPRPWALVNHEAFAWVRKIAGALTNPNQAEQQGQATNAA